MLQRLGSFARAYFRRLGGDGLSAMWTVFAIFEELIDDQWYERRVRTAAIVALFIQGEVLAKGKNKQAGRARQYAAT